MQLRHLRYFVRVCELGSFRRAAANLNIAQPAISRRISDLEAELGVGLFVRRPTGIEMTDAGRFFFQRARSALDEIDDAVRMAREIGRKPADSLSVSFHEVAIRHPILSVACEQYRLQYPAVALRLFPMSSPEQIRAIRSGEIDVGFMFNFMREDSDLDFVGIGIESWRLAVPCNHRLNGQNAVRLEELEGDGFVFVPRESYPDYYDILMDQFRARGIKPRVVQEAKYGGELLALVAAGSGISIVCTPTWPRPGVCFIDIVDIRPSLNFDLVWRRGDYRTHVKIFVQMVDNLRGPALPPKSLSAELTR